MASLGHSPLPRVGPEGAPYQGVRIRDGGHSSKPRLKNHDNTKCPGCQQLFSSPGLTPGLTPREPRGWAKMALWGDFPLTGCGEVFSYLVFFFFSLIYIYTCPRLPQGGPGRVGGGQNSPTPGVPGGMSGGKSGGIAGGMGRDGWSNLGTGGCGATVPPLFCPLTHFSLAPLGKTWYHRIPPSGGRKATQVAVER